ncbi:hypothetical protein [Geosporobacter ferrireducens]|uniref:NHLP bacteriocin system secretion protein n=1 Tax=Geosporobacter ferrireducens TaxID=1424294 RepID=A0A1D8GDG4_9FIRM|nr:hypothetical protein [Geosporobacter ferrireducens]AOT68949.1 hypothetical protein Gferi_04900 [Geosporobacter ferrireducens]MTI54809.1 hypothetical protein [Geosporobacter ferrireducens]
MDNNLFRKEAISEITSPDSLDQAIRITDRKIHLMTFGIVFIILAGIFWGFNGSIPVILQGSGIIMPDGGMHYIISQQQGIVRDILVKQGEYVRDGEIVGSLEVVDESGNTKRMDIIAGINGRVSEVRSLSGDFVESKEKLFSVVSVVENQNILEAIIFVPIEQGKNLRQGLDVHIQPSNVNKEEYGFIKGVVQQVSEYPVSRKRLLALLGSEALVSRFSDGQVVLEVEVDLILNDKTMSGYQWSTPNGPPFNIYEGTLCYADFILEMKKPIDLVIYGR